MIEDRLPDVTRAVHGRLPRRAQQDCAPAVGAFRRPFPSARGPAAPPDIIAPIP